MGRMGPMGQLGIDPIRPISPIGSIGPIETSPLLELIREESRLVVTLQCVT
jgi:hypothetical protein